MRRCWKVYGREGHRQKETFCKSVIYTHDDVRFQVLNADETGTNEFSIVIIDAASAEDCERELFAQLGDGEFENCNTGNIVEVNPNFIKQSNE